MDDTRNPQDQLEGISYTTDTVQELLEGVTFPIETHALVRHLEDRTAPQPVVEGLRTSGVDQFGSIEEIMDIVGGYAV